ncbi:hypothetical protein pb186bvf_019799 [Paramecium bursaria]
MQKQLHVPGKRIKNYVIIKQIGSGGYGRVYQVQHTLTNEFYAMKAVAQSTFKNHNGKVGFLHQSEIDNMKRIDSPFVVKFVESFEQHKYSYIVMEYCNEGDIEKLWLTKNKQFDENETLYYMKQIISGMKDLHQHSIMHRDIKMKNILLHNNQIKIGDLGFSKQLITEDFDEICMGMLGYMAPEVIDCLPYGLECDIYSLGALIYLFMNGQLPFSDKNHEEFMKQASKNNLQFKNDISIKMKDLITGMLQFDRKQRLTWEYLYQLDKNF